MDSTTKSVSVSETVQASVSNRSVSLDITLQARVSANGEDISSSPLLTVQEHFLSAASSQVSQRSFNSIEQVCHFLTENLKPPTLNSGLSIYSHSLKWDTELPSFSLGYATKYSRPHSTTEQTFTLAFSPTPKYDITADLVFLSGTIDIEASFPFTELVRFVLQHHIFENAHRTGHLPDTIFAFTSRFEVQPDSLKLTIRDIAAHTTISSTHIPPTRTARSPIVGNSMPDPTLCVLSIGSNISPRFEQIEHALQSLESSNVRILDTSFMYETAPVHVEDQQRFANCACLIESALSPTHLLDRLKDIELQLGRKETIRFGPRNIDLDIIFFGEQIIKNVGKGRDLIVPHERAHQREFVLRPIADIIPTFVHPVLRRSILELLGCIPNPDSTLLRVLPLPSRTSRDRYLPLGPKTYLMATLNVTPDSFSDGGQHYHLDDAMEYVQMSVANGADIIDVGGYSTRPHATEVSIDEEERRVVPVIQRIRHSYPDVVISVDTFRGAVAKSAVEAGADIVNDIRALDGDLTPDSMRQTVAGLGVPAVLMHSRGDAGSNKDYSSFGAGGVIAGVRSELGEKVRKARDTQGMRRWNIVVDPGIGFSKTMEGNLALLREHRTLTSETEYGARREHHTIRSAWNYQRRYGNPMAHMPTLIGTSRKSFLASVLGDKNRAASDRVWATGGTVAAAIQQGVDMVRVHDVKEMRDVKLVADAIWRVAKRK